MPTYTPEQVKNCEIWRDLEKKGFTPPVTVQRDACKGGFLKTVAGMLADTLEIRTERKLPISKCP